MSCGQISIIHPSLAATGLGSPDFQRVWGCFVLAIALLVSSQAWGFEKLMDR